VQFAMHHACAYNKSFKHGEAGETVSKRRKYKDDFKRTKVLGVGCKGVPACTRLSAAGRVLSLYFETIGPTAAGIRAEWSNAGCS